MVYPISRRGIIIMESIDNKQEKKVDIKANWLKEDILCENCGQVVYKQKGITKQSMKRLFSFNFKNPQEWVWTAMIIGVCFLAWAYKNETASCNELMENRIEYCTQFLNDMAVGNEFVFKINGTLNGIANNTNLWNP